MIMGDRKANNMGTVKIYSPVQSISNFFFYLRKK